MRKVPLVVCLISVLLFSSGSVFAGRYYIPEVARWATPDPALQKLKQDELLRIHNGRLLGTSLYSYGFGNPLRYTDPDGNIPAPVVGAIGGALFDVAIQVLVECKSLTDLNFKSVAISAGAGAVGAGLLSKFNRLRKLVRLGSKVDNVINFADEATRSGTKLTKEASKSIRSLERQIARHRQKLAEFKKNPDAFDNKGLLKNAPSKEIRDKIIQGRIKKIEKEIRTFEKAIEKLLKGEK